MKGIPLISHITQKDGGDFWLVDSNAIYGGLYHVNSPNQMRSLPEKRLKYGMLCYVENEDKYYKYMGGEEWIPWINKDWALDEVIDEEEIQQIMGIFKDDTN